MFSNAQNQPQSATIINIHSPEDEMQPVTESSFGRRPSSTSRPTSQPSAQSHTKPKPSPKVEEYRKMIQHITNKIIKRKRPPTALSHLNDFSRTTQVNNTFENDDTIDLLIQLRSALMVCHQIGLSSQVLFQGERTPTNSPLSSRSNSPLPSPRIESPIRSPEPFGSAVPLFSIANNQSSKSHTEFDIILYILSDLVLNDSRYKTSNPKPSRPPFTMQAILIDLATILTQIRDDSSGLYLIGTVFMPAFESFSEGTMLGRLLAFFIDSLLPKLMKCKDEPKSRLNNKTTYNESSTKAVQTKTVHPNTPTINIQSAEPDQLSVPTKASHLTIDTRPLTVAAQSSSPISPAALSVNSNNQAQSLSAYHAFSLFTPLLFFMIQYLDPYLAAQPSRAQQDNLTYTLTRQANSIHNFHKALSYMMSCKPDLYLDLLDIISHSTSEVKFRACQVLFNYYIVSVGHVVVADPLPRLGTQEELEILDQRRLQQELEEEHQRNHQQLNSHSTTQNRTAKDPTRAELVEDDWVEEQHVWYSYMFDENDSNAKILSNNPFSFGAYKSTTDSHCKECFKPIQGCGLHCFQCRSNIHIDCHNSKMQMDGHGMLFYMKAGNIQKVVAPQYCIVPPQPRCRDMVDRGLLQWNIKSSAPKVGLLGHLFQLINLFTATLCICCHLPLWGTCLQAYQCTTCFRFIHPECLAEIEESNNLSSVHSHNPLSPSTSAHRLQKCSFKSSLQESDITISQADLEKSLAAFYDDALSTQSESLRGKSFEEVGLMVNTLLIQENILHCGVASGCMIITQESDDPLLLTTDTLHKQGRPSSHSALLSQAINAYSDFLESAENVHVSTFFVDFFDHSDFTAVKHLMNKQDFLYHLGAMMKSLVTSSDDSISNFAINNRQHKRTSDNSQGFLQVSPSPFATNTWDDDEYNNELDESHTPNENLDRSVLLSWIMTNLNFKSLRAAEILLQHMRNIGIFERFDASPLLFVRHATAEKVESEPAVQCIFPVPCAIDFSASVESLVNSIEACVQDIDLSINECGLLLLTRRCWPDRFMSYYTQERLIRAIIGWTFDEDERLLALHAEITSLNRHSSLHHSKQQNKWVQAALLARMKVPASAERSRQSTFHVNTTAPSVNSGASNIYVTTRAGLKDRYVVRWMSAIQGMNPETYTDMIFNAIEEIIDSKREECILPDWEELSEVKNHTLQKYELFINYITKLKNNGLTFNSLDSILEKWFERTYAEFQVLGMLQDKEPSELRNLVKLCSTKPTHGRIPTNMSSSSVNPIDLVVSQFQNKDKHVIDRGMRWLTLMTYSGVDLTSNALSRISKLLIESKVSLKTIVEFVKIVWFQVVHVNAFAARRAVIADIVGYLSESISETLESFNNDQDLSDESLIDAQSFVKYCAALVCFAYGCSTEEIIKATLVPFTGDHTIKASKKSVTIDHDLIEVDENTPSIDNMLSFLKYDQLNLREYVVKMFYCITQWGHGISNKEELINACISKLIPV
ncbi:hypothetical protein EDC96DRAFT_133631 [Choanephora cucurbitarum]|nr:hypothetical protein EDC96DRAFT_133631 [Choanephora cucurbitarum]